MACLCDFTHGAHQLGLAEEVAGTHAELAADNLFVQSVVAVDYHIVDAGLRAFDHSHFEGYGVAFDFALDGYELVEEVALVHIEVRHGVVVGGEALVEQLLVVYVARLHVEVGVEHVVGVDCVAHPVYVFDKVLLAFVEVDVHVNVVLIVGHYAVGCNLGVAVAFLVVLFEYSVEVVLIVALHEFFLAEEFEKIFFLVCFLHGSFESAVAQHLVAVKVDFVYFHLVVLVDNDIDKHLVFVR